MDKCTVIFPVFNESPRVMQTFEAAVAFGKYQPDCDFLFVDDGSTDNTAALIHRGLSVNGSSEKVRILRLPENRGKGAAVQAGVAANSSSLVCFFDGDMAYDLKHLHAMRQALAEYDVVIGNRAMGAENRGKIPLLRRLLGGCFNRLVRLALGLPFADTQAGLKGFRMDAASDVFPRLTVSRFAFDVEVLVIARNRGYSIGEIPAVVSQAHSEKVSNVRCFRDSLRMFLSLLKVRYFEAIGRYD